MTMTRWWKVASILCALAATTSGVVSLAGKDPAVDEPGAVAKPEAAQTGEVAFSEVKPGRFSVTLAQRGNLEASRNESAICKVEGQSKIIWILPEGTKVTKGQLVCELDSAALRDALTNQVSASNQAEAAHKRAQLNREVAEIALKEYTDGVYPQDRLKALGAIERTRSAITKAEERVKRTHAARERLDTILTEQGGVKTPADIVARLDLEDRLDETEQILRRERTALEIEQTKLKVLEEFTKAKTIKALESEAERTRSQELAMQATLELESSKQAKLERQIVACKVLAPGNGMVVYADDRSPVDGRPGFQIEEGAIVRERQIIFYLPDLSGPMRINTKIPEAVVHQIRQGLRARVKVDAFADQTLSGVVEDVAPVPDPRSVFRSDIKVYTAHVLIENAIPGLRPGMTASVEILVADLDNVLSVPAQAVVSYEGKDHVAVKKPDGRIDWREVTLGLSDGKMVEIKEGLKSGETVASDPAPLLSEDQKHKMSLTQQASPNDPGKGAGLPRAKSPRVGIPPSLRAKLQAINPDERVKLRTATPEQTEAILKKAGFTDDELRLLNQIRELREPSNLPR
jgi:RND family efflux transporter MFP subunit